MLEKSITFMATCDYCSNDFDTDETDFHSAVQRMKRESWKVFKEVDNSWAHKCDNCLQEEREENAAKYDGSEFD